MVEHEQDIENTVFFTFSEEIELALNINTVITKNKQRTQKKNLLNKCY